MHYYYLLQEELEKATKEYDRAVHQKNSGKTPTHKLGCLGLVGASVPAVEFWEQKKSQLSQKIVELRESERKENFSVGRVGFVTFTNLSTASCAARVYF
jgi:hypothetical protein